MSYNLIDCSLKEFSHLIGYLLYYYLAYMDYIQSLNELIPWAILFWIHIVSDVWGNSRLLSLRLSLGAMTTTASARISAINWNW